MTDLFKGKTVLVTGGAGAIGTAIAQTFYFYGARVVCVDNKPFDIPGVDCIEADLSLSPNMYRLIGAVQESEGKIDMACHCMGLSIPNAWNDVKGMDVTNQFDVNARSAILATGLVSAGMVAQGGGHILLFGSGVEDEFTKTHSVYAASKAAVRAYGLIVAHELAPKKVYVNVCWPSATSNMNKKSRHSPQDVADFAAALFLTKKWGCLFSVAGKKIALVGEREYHLLDDKFSVRT